VLVNGRIEGLWEQEKKSSGTTVSVEMFQPPGPEVRHGIEAEVERLGTFLDTRVEVAYR
jgi:hypothetical protein